MDLNKLFTNNRTGNNKNQIVYRDDFQRDYDRIVFSSAFRRLQNKTQVFPLPGSVFVHNRLTHSLEVASVGRSLGSLIGNYISEEFHRELEPTSQEFYRYHLSSVISAACLCHDIGNPAFGHSGEDAIASYFEKNEELKKHFTDEQWADLVNFEGNANAIRVLTQKQNGKIDGGTQLTYTTLASIAKYPCEAMGKDKKQLHRKKFGFFQAEKDTFRKIAEETSMILEQEHPLVYKRHPFVWIVEAADDICYNIIDIEDAHRLGIISTNDCKELLFQLLFSLEEDKKKMKKNLEKKLKIVTNCNEQIAYPRAKVINALVNKTFNLFKENFKAILDGNLDISLLGMLQKENQSLQDIERFSVEKIYNHKSVIEIENAGYNVMYELLHHFIPSVIKKENERKNYDKKALLLVPQQFIHERTGEDFIYKNVLGIIDFISGMTDNFATDLYRKIKGIEIGMTM